MREASPLLIEQQGNSNSWGGGRCEIANQKRERGAISGPPSLVFFVLYLGSVRGALPRCTPQERCRHLAFVFMSGGVITPPVSIPFLSTPLCSQMQALL